MEAVLRDLTIGKAEAVCPAGALALLPPRERLGLFLATQMFCAGDQRNATI